MYIIAHRGGAEDHITEENKLQTVEKTLSLPVDMIEVDLRIYNNEIILSHDPITPSDPYDTLEDLLNLVNGKIPLNLELKEHAVAEKLVSVLSGYRGKILLSSFDYTTLKECKKLFPNIELAVLEKWSGVRATYRARRLGTKRIHMDQRWLWSGFIKAMKRSGYELYSYTVNSVSQAKRFEKSGIAGIFTDYPGKFN